MGKDGKKPPTGKDGRRKPFHVVRSDESVLSKPSLEMVKQLYMASGHLEWIPFAQSMKWDPTTTRDQFPVADWIHQKKEQLARTQAEQISELVFDHRSRWHREVLKTLRDYPEAVDAALGIIKHRENELIAMINSDMEEKQRAQIEGREPHLKFPKVKTSELLALATAVKVATEAKHKSLLINDWSVKVAEQFTDPKQFEREEEKLKDTEWKIEVIGGENLTTAQMQEFIGRYYDKPRNLHTQEEIAPPMMEETIEDEE